MKTKKTPTQPAEPVFVLASISTQDRPAAEKALAKYPAVKWCFPESSNEAQNFLRKNRVALVLHEDGYNELDWRDLLAFMQELQNQPLLIVASRLADEVLWSKALNQGAYDILARPFDEHEIGRVLPGALRRWSLDNSFAL